MKSEGALTGRTSFRPGTILLILCGGLYLCWPAIINHQPFFFQDTSAYVRASDYAVSKLFGGNTNTIWSKQPRYSDNLSDAESIDHESGKALRNSNLSSIENQTVLLGRSPYYGALLYLGHLAGGFWLSILVQGAVASALIFLVASKLFRRPMRQSVVLIGALGVGSSLPFFVGYLMPDIFAGLALLSGAMFAAFYEQWTRLERFVLWAVMSYAAMSHTSIVLLIVGLWFLVALIAIVKSQSMLQPVKNKLIGIGSAIVIAGIANFAVTKAVNVLVGKPPIMPPFLSARVIEDGPGYLHAKSNCPQKGYEICKYSNRLPLTAGEFLWGLHPERSLFATVDSDSRRALSDEQFSFVANAVAEYPLLSLKQSLRNWGMQIVKFNLENLNYSRSEREFYQSKLPPEYFVPMTSTLAYRDLIPAALLSGIQVLIFIPAALYSVISLVAVANRSKNSSEDGIEKATGRRLVLFCTIVLMGILLNAAICGVLSAPADRYQARIVWLVLFVAILFDLYTRCSWWDRVLRMDSGEVQ